MSVENDLAALLESIEAEYGDYSDDERTIIDSWIAKLKEPAEDETEQSNLLAYADALAKLVTLKQPLSSPFDEMPPATLPSLLKKVSGQSKKQSFQIKRMPCNRPRNQEDASPKPKKIDKSKKFSAELPSYNEFEDPEEMAKAIARSKGQTFAEFVASISRYTKDFGQELRTALKAETSGFREYVDHVLSQRIKDLTEVLDEEQNRELLKIKKDTDKWQLELANVKRRIKELIPTFDIDAYRKDPKYLNKQFTIGKPGLPQDDSFQRWQEENCHRLKWIAEMTNKMSRCNEEINQEILDIKSEALDLEAKEAMKQQNNVKLINCEIADYQRLKQERDQLLKENAELLSQVQQSGR